MIHSHWIAMVVLAVVTFKSDNLREKRSVPLTKYSNIAYFKILVVYPLKNRCSGQIFLNYDFIILTLPKITSQLHIRKSLYL